MSYIGIQPSDAGAANRYGFGGLFNQPMYLTLGTVLNSFQSAQFCEVSLDTGGRRSALYLGNGRGRLGAFEAGGPLPGERVLVACSFSDTSPAVIVARYDYAKAGEYVPPCNLLVQPQVAGFEYGARMSGQTYSDFPRAGRNFTSGPMDAVDGDWIMANMFGGAVGVEAFRTFIKGGPASGVYCYTEDQVTRIIGSRIEMISFSETSQEVETGDLPLKLLYRYLTAGDQLVGYQPQYLRAVGKAVAGEQIFLTYPDGMNGSGVQVSRPEEEEDEEPEEGNGNGDDDFDVDTGKARIALIHEYRGADGSWALTAANSILLQKTLDVPVPIDVIEAQTRIDQEKQRIRDEEEGEETEEDDPPLAAGTCGCDSCELTADPPTPQCEDDDPQEPCEENPTFRFDSNAKPNPLAFAMNARGLADRLIQWQAVGGFTNLCRFDQGDEPNELFGGRTPGELLMSKSPDMWKCMPQSIKLGLKIDGSAKRYYFGRAIISITEDGSIVLQDAHGSQVMLSGGNVFISAQHDIINYAGRNLMDMSGRDMCKRAGRHLDLHANEGRLTAIASQQASLVGGIDGHAGVLIESRGNHIATNDTGANPATSGGVVIKAEHMVGIRAGHVALRGVSPTGWSGSSEGAGLVTLDADDRVTMRGAEGGAYCTVGQAFYVQAEEGGLAFDGRTLLTDASIQTNQTMCYRRMRRMMDEGQVTQFKLLGFKTALLDNFKWVSFGNCPLEMSDFNAHWLGSDQYGFLDEKYFTIPVPEWQLRAESAFEDGSVLVDSTVNDNLVDDFYAAFPGIEAWTGFGLSRIEYEPAEWGGTPVVNFTVTAGSIDGDLLKGI